ncbi:hypothetical protein RA876_13610 [Rhodoferax antarcticus]|nr:hypothetical protein RA876_13610 [Rhodoferax antarcticus]
MVIITQYNVIITKDKTMPTNEAPKKPGRPAKYGQPMSDTMRAASYRTRRREAASAAHENLKEAAPAVLLAALVRQFKALANPDLDHAPVTRELAGLIMAELCERYEIPLPRSPGAI